MRQRPREAPRPSSEAGNPGVFVRLEPAVLARLREIAGATQPGRAGGIPNLIRQLVYDLLELPSPGGPTGNLPAARAMALAAEGWTVPQICLQLEEEEFLTSRGRRHWDPTQVRRLLQRERDGTPK